jgi:hypothetical protein
VILLKKMVSQNADSGKTLLMNLQIVNPKPKVAFQQSSQQRSHARVISPRQRSPDAVQPGLYFGLLAVLNRGGGEAFLPVFDRD